MSNASRIDRISGEYTRALAEALRTLKDPRVSGIVSITRCEVTRDLRYAKVYISVLGSEEQQKQALKGLKSAAGYLRREAASRMTLRAAPEPTFFSDDSIRRGTGLMKTLRDIENQPKKASVQVKLSRTEVRALLDASDNILILSHTRPDGDTIGSAAALCRFLRKDEKTAYVLENPELTPRYEFLFSGITAPEDFKPDFVVAVDVAADDMLQTNALHYSGYIDLLIDHHCGKSEFSGRVLRDSTSAATGEIIRSLYPECALDKATAEAIYTSVSTDTGCFRYSNTTAVTLTLAAECLNAGIDAYSLNRAFFEEKTIARMRLEGDIQQNLEFFDGGRISLAVIEGKTLEKYAVTEDDLDGIAAIAANVEGVEVGITATQRGDSVKVSVRTGDGANAAEICQSFSGGGHLRAAGCTIADMTAAEAGRAVAAEAERMAAERN